MKNILVPFLISSSIIILLFLAFSSFETEMEQVLQRIMENKQLYSFVSGGILISDIVLPVPSSVVMYMNGFVLDRWIGTMLSFFSLMISSLIGYFIGSIPKYYQNKKGGVTSNTIFNSFGSFAILLTRGIPILSESICIICGYNKMPLKKYLLISALGFLPICFLYAQMGEIASDRNVFLLVLGLSIGVTILFWIGGFLLSKLSKSQQHS